jgi:hypothetical protein
MPSASVLVWLFTQSLLLPHEPASVPLAAPGDFPSSGSVWGFIETALPAVTSDRFDSGGTGIGVPAKLGAYGGSWTQATYRLGDLDITNPLRPGTPIVLPDAPGLERASILSAPSLAEVSATGPRIDLAPLRPGKALEGSFQGVFTGRGWAATATDPPAISSLRSLEDASFAFSGPISDRAGAAVAAHFVHGTRVERNKAPDQTAKLASFTGHVVVAPRGNDEIRVLGVYQQAEHPNEAWLALDDTAQAQDRLALFHVAWERTAPDHLAWRVAGGVQHAFLDPATSTVTPTIDAVNDGALIPILFQPAGSTTTVRLAGDLRRRSSSTSAHDWRIGVTFEHDSMHPELLAADSAAEMVNGQAARFWLFDTQLTTPVWHETTTSIFAADRIKLGARAEIEGSVRLETIAGSNGGTTSVSWIDIYPRILAKATLSQRAGLGVFLDVSRAGLPLPPMALAFGDPASPTGRVFAWTDTNHDGIAQPLEVGALVQRIGPGAGTSGLSEIDSALARPAQTQWVFGMSIDRPNWAVTLSGIVRRQSNVIQATDPGASYTLIQVPDEGLDYPGPKTSTLDTYSRTPASFGLDHYVLTNSSGLTPTFEGVDANVQLRWEHAALAFGATAARAYATTAIRGFRADENDPSAIDLAANPNALVNARGRPFYDRGYTGKIAMAFHLPYQVNIGAVVRYLDGQPFTRLAEATGLTQGVEPVRAYPAGRTRFSFVGSADVRVQKDFTIGRGRIGVFVDVFDLFNTTREVEEVVATSPAFRTVSAVEPPRSVRIGLRVGF